MANPTEGEWEPGQVEVVPAPTFDVSAVDRDNLGFARFTVNTDIAYGTDEADAATTLVEAAPDLLAALEAIVKGELKGGTIGEYHIAVSTADFDAAMDAITKARGG